MNPIRTCFFLIVKKIKTLFKARVFSMGGVVTIYPSASFSLKYNKTGHIRIGKNSRIGTSDRGYRIAFFHPTRISARGEGAIIEIGENARISGANIFARNSIKIGNNVEIAAGVQITDLNGHLTYSLNRTIGEDTPNPIVIGDNVWIGLNAIILKGTEIGDNCIVSAGSVVKGKFPANSVITGNPAIVVKTLDFGDECIKPENRSN